MVTSYIKALALAAALLAYLALLEGVGYVLSKKSLPAHVQRVDQVG